MAGFANTVLEVVNLGIEQNLGFCAVTQIINKTFVFGKDGILGNDFSLLSNGLPVRCRCIYALFMNVCESRIYYRLHFCDLNTEVCDLNTEGTLYTSYMRLGRTLFFEQDSAVTEGHNLVSASTSFVLTEEEKQYFGVIF